MRQLVGSTPFSDRSLHHASPLDPELDDTPRGSSLPLSIEQKRKIYASYTIQSSGILHLFSHEEAQSLLHDDLLKPNPGSRREDLAAFDTALAIGAQAQAKISGHESCGNAYSVWAATYFTRARAVAFEKMLANPSLGLVRLFVLLAFYSLGSYRQIPAAIDLGIASKIAVILGLHQPMSPKVVRQGGDHALRLRVWHSLCILDVLSSSLLGRPCTAPRATRHDIKALPLNPAQPQFNAILLAAALLDDVCIALNGSKVIDAKTAQDLLARLRAWSQSLTPNLRRFASRNAPASSDDDARLVFGNLHVSSVYYFTVVLVTRPFLVRHLSSKTRPRTSLAMKAPTDPADATLAQVCIASATYMGQLCCVLADMRAHEQSPPSSLLSLFKAWAFGSGLVLGYSMLADGARPEVDDAFRGILLILDTDAESEPQSRRYAETLNALADTICIHQRISAQRLSHAAEPFVEQILNISPGQHEDTTRDPGVTSTTTIDYLDGMINHDALHADGMHDMDHDWANLGIEFLEPCGEDFSAGFA